MIQNISELPREMIFKICSYLDIGSILVLSYVYNTLDWIRPAGHQFFEYRNMKQFKSKVIDKSEEVANHKLGCECDCECENMWEDADGVYYGGRDEHGADRVSLLQINLPIDVNEIRISISEGDTPLEPLLEYGDFNYYGWFEKTSMTRITPFKNQFIWKKAIEDEMDYETEYTFFPSVLSANNSLIVSISNIETLETITKKISYNICLFQSPTHRRNTTADPPAYSFPKDCDPFYMLPIGIRTRREAELYRRKPHLFKEKKKKKREMIERMHMCMHVNCAIKCYYVK